MQQMQAQLQQQAQQLAHQQQQLAHAQQQAAAPAPQAAPAVAAPRPLVKPRAPSTFNASDRAGELDQWEREMRYQFAAYGAALSAEPARIAHAVSYLGAIPLQWWDANPAHHDVDTWAGFVRLLRERFRPVNAAKLARIELFKLRQAAAQTAGAHAARFQELLVSLPNMHEDDKIHLFVHSLTPALKRRVADKEFATLGAAINAAVQTEGLYGAQLATDAPSSSSAAHASGSSMDVNALDEEDQLAMLSERLFALEAAHAQGAGAGRGHSSRSLDARVPHVSHAQIQDRRERGACFACGELGHRKQDCPIAKRK